MQTHPMALTKLAAFFHDAYFQKKKKLKPLVVIGPTNNNGVCLVVGYTGQPRSADNQVIPPVPSGGAPLNSAL